MTPTAVPVCDADLAAIPNYAQMRERFSVAFCAGLPVASAADTEEAALTQRIQAELPKNLAHQPQLMAAVTRQVYANAAELLDAARNPAIN